MNIIIITGASSGMGYELAKQIDKIYTNKLDEIWLIARRISKLEELSDSLSHVTRLFPSDITNELDMQSIQESLNIMCPNVLLLANVAGYGVMGNVIDLSEDELVKTTRINCESVIRLTQIVLPYIPKGGRIINFSSSAAFLPQPGFAVYAASKTYILNYTRALNAELKVRKITATAVCPGPVNTDFLKTAQKYSKTPEYKKLFYKKADEVVKKALIDSYKRRELSIYSFSMRCLYIISKFVPHRLILKFIK